jgi:broad specificity phosphatase PhoE
MARPRLIILIRHAQSEGNSTSDHLAEACPSSTYLQEKWPGEHKTDDDSPTSTENRDIHQTIPDHRVKLTQEGWDQAYEAGRKLRAMLRPEDTLHFFTSPYRRTRETTEGILATLTSDETEPSPFKRNNIKVYEEPRLREQDFGNFQPCSAEMERMWQERADYGHFFYRIPNGESAADAYDRISGFNESLWRQFGDDDFSSVCVLGTLLPQNEREY